MRKNWIFAGAAMMALAACSQAGDETSADQAYEESAYDAGSSTDMAEPLAEFAPADRRTATTSVDGSAIPDLGAIPVNVPQLAYTYDFHWSLPADDIGELQRKHARLCEDQGPAQCQILGMSKTGEFDDEVRGVLEMAVASQSARAFGDKLEDTANDAGAEQISAEIASEELSKQIVDTEARLRARIELRDRLLEVLRTRRGTVAELVEAERSVARVNEEIDQARSWLAAMEGRVAYSRVTVRYDTGVPISSDFLTPITGAAGALGSIFGYIVAILMLLASIAIPFGLVVWGIRSAQRRWGTPPEVYGPSA